MVVVVVVAAVAVVVCYLRILDEHATSNNLDFPVSRPAENCLWMSHTYKYKTTAQHFTYFVLT